MALTWEEYGRSIIDGFAELKGEMRETRLQLSQVAIAISLLQASSESVAAFEKRLQTLEQAIEAAEDRVSTYRRSLIAVGLTLLGTILLPIIRAYATTKGGG